MLNTECKCIIQSHHKTRREFVHVCLKVLIRYLSLSMFPWSIYEINGEELHGQAPHNATDHNFQAFTVPDHEAMVVQFICHLLEV